MAAAGTFILHIVAALLAIGCVLAAVAIWSIRHERKVEANIRTLRRLGHVRGHL